MSGTYFDRAPENAEDNPNAINPRLETFRWAPCRMFRRIRSATVPAMQVQHTALDGCTCIARRLFQRLHHRQVGLRAVANPRHTQLRKLAQRRRLLTNHDVERKR
jgi:hypothetical protein